MVDAVMFSLVVTPKAALRPNLHATEQVATVVSLGLYRTDVDRSSACTVGILMGEAVTSQYVFTACLLISSCAILHMHRNVGEY